MPYGDGTGPMGMGPRTGRAAGYCAGYSAPGYMNQVRGRAFLGRGYGGFGRGGGHRWRHWYYETGLPGWARAGYPDFGGIGAPYGYEPSPKEEADFLKAQVEVLKRNLETIQNRISALEREEKK